MAAPVSSWRTSARERPASPGIPPERRGGSSGHPARAAEILAEYVDAGFGGFTFANTMLPGESLDLAAS